jgi:HlyD family secretion protein
MLFKRVSFYLAVAGIVGAALLVLELRKTPPAPDPVQQPARSPYADAVAATGIIEAARENVNIGAPKGGLIQKICVSVGSPVKAGEPILQLDDREARAQLGAMKAQLEAMRASLRNDKVLADDADDQFSRTDTLLKQNVA